MSGSTPTLRCSCCGTRLWVKLHTSAELKSIRIVVPTVLGELRCGHITSVSSGLISYAQDSDDPLFVVNIVVWVLVVILAIVTLHCPLSRRVVR